METIRVANAEQAEHWNSTEADHWVAEQARYDEMLEPFTAPLLGAAAISPTDRVLDIGCGCGATTRAAARRTVGGSVVGVDLSAPMLTRARELTDAEGLANARFENGDAQVHPMPADAFDVAISRFGVMFFGDPVAAFANIRRAVRPGGRLAFLCWQSLFDNQWMTVPATAALCHVPMPNLGAPGAAGPFALADPADIEKTLVAAGWERPRMEPVRAVQRFGADIDDTVSFIAATPLAKTLLAGVDDEVRQRAIGAVRDALVPFASPDGVFLEGAAWLVTSTWESG